MKTAFWMLLIPLWWGCTSPRFVYTPSAINNPFLTQKGEGELHAMYSTSNSESNTGNSEGGVNGLDVMGSYAVSNHFAMQAHYFFRDEKDVYTLSWPSDLDGTVKSSRNELQLGIGGFVPLDRSKTIFLSGWAGVGFGGSEINERFVATGGGNTVKEGDFKFKTTRLYFQPSFNFIVSERFKAGLISKFSSIRFKDVITSFNEIELAERYLDLLEGSNISVIEAGYNISFGFRGLNNLLFTNQLTFSGSINDNRNTRPLNFSIGMSYVIKPTKTSEKARSQ